MEVPCSPWMAEPPGDPAAFAPFAADWRFLPGIVRHGFTHFRTEVTVATAALPREVEPGGRWVPLEALATVGLPTAMRKVARHALAHTGEPAAQESPASARTGAKLRR